MSAMEKAQALVQRFEALAEYLDDGRMPKPYEFYRAIKREGEASGWSYEVMNLGLSDIEAILAALRELLAVKESDPVERPDIGPAEEVFAARDALDAAGFAGWPVADAIHEMQARLGRAALTLDEIVARADNHAPGTSKVQDMKRLAAKEVALLRDQNDIADTSRTRMSEALDAALVELFKYEPGDSRAVSDLFVAMAAVSAGIGDEKSDVIIRDFLREAKRGVDHVSV